MESYLKALKKSPTIDPNFWCSSEYARHAGWSVVQLPVLGVVGVVDDKTGELMLPYIREADGKFMDVGEEVWADLVATFPTNPSLGLHFLDYEFIFDSSCFLPGNMTGKEWAVTRKNVRKWPKRHGQDADGNQQWVYRPMSALDDSDPYQLNDLLIDWLETKPNEMIHDDDVMLAYLTKGKNRWGLWTTDGTLHAVNIWDENYAYMNFRYCICRNTPFLSDFARHLFYTWNAEGRLVNDGGALDNDNLYQYKMRMNPLLIRRVFSWRKRGEPK